MRRTARRAARGTCRFRSLPAKGREAEVRKMLALYEEMEGRDYERAQLQLAIARSLIQREIVSACSSCW